MQAVCERLDWKPGKCVATQTQNQKSIVAGIRKFLDYGTPNAGGGRPKDVQDAIDAVVTACVFDTEETCLPSISSELSIQTQVAQKRYNVAVSLVESGDPYQPNKRKERSDNTRDIAHACVMEWCHSVGARVDTNAKTVHKVTALSGLEEKHPQHIWEEVTWESRFRSFQNSDVYEQYTSEYPQLSIGKTVFGESCCSCIRKPRQESCVDILCSGGQEHTNALRQAFNNKAIKRELEKCTCAVHGGADDPGVCP